MVAAPPHQTRPKRAASVSSASAFRGSELHARVCKAAGQPRVRVECGCQLDPLRPGSLTVSGRRCRCAAAPLGAACALYSSAACVRGHCPLERASASWRSRHLNPVARRLARPLLRGGPAEYPPLAGCSWRGHCCAHGGKGRFRGGDSRRGGVSSFGTEQSAKRRTEPDIFGGRNRLKARASCERVRRHFPPPQRTRALTHHTPTRADAAVLRVLCVGAVRHCACRVRR